MVAANSRISKRAKPSNRSPSVLQMRFRQELSSDRFTRDDAHYRVAVDYIHSNPVKAGLVKSAGGWKWSSAAADGALSRGSL
jgi:hypothetical protein